LGRGTMTDYMKRFGFYAKAPVDLPSDEVGISRPYTPAGDPYAAGSPDEDIGRIAIGQGGLEVSPLQMAMVASAVANGGRLMKPHLTSKIVDPDGRTIQTIAPTLWHQVMTPSTATQVAEMMKKVVDEGTGTPAQLGSGITFAGKTGTASVGPTGEGETQPWFIGFAPIQDPKVAIAVTVERTDGGFGGTVAAPIAKAVVQELLAEGK
jgi:peptidoglycan glycosyltransferase